MISYFKLHIIPPNLLSFLKPKSILKVSFILLILGIFTSSSNHAQLVYSTNNKFAADVSVYVTDNKFSADLLVFKCDSQFSAKKKTKVCGILQTTNSLQIKLFFSQTINFQLI